MNEDKILLDAAINMLAEWCLDVELEGSWWDNWDENYKNANYRPGLLRDLIDLEKEKVRAQRAEW